MTVAGVMLLAMGSAALNSLQEVRIDSQMVRTSKRPLPMKLISSRSAICLTIILLLCGSIILFVSLPSVQPLLVALLTVIFYNGIYTPLKQKSILAIAPGALCGALPPYIGWIAAGGEYFAFIPILLVSLFILWQVPHFWLVMLNYKKDYLQGDQPSLLQKLQESSIQRFFVTWVGGLVFVMFMFAILPLEIGRVFQGGVIVNGLFLLVFFIYGLVISSRTNYRILFNVLNICLFQHMAVLSLGRLVV